MEAVRTQGQEAAEDIFFGQLVLIWARWFIIVGAALLLLLTSDTVDELIVATIFVVVLMGINFFIHGRYMLERPANRVLLSIMSILDVVVVTLVVSAWGDQSGLNSPYFIFYFPVVLAFAFVFEPRQSIVFTLLASGAYFGVAIYLDAGILTNSLELEILVTRIIALASVGGLATYYWRIQRNRRRDLIMNFANPENA